MKHTIKLLTLAFMLATILTLAGCPGPVTPDMPCTHENKKTVIETAATCTETGLEKIICADCGELIEEKEIDIDPANHDFGEWEITEKPTCTEKGSKTGECSRCGETETVEIDALGHDWILEKENDDTHKCTNCETTAHHTFIAGGCDICGAYEHNKEDDYQIKAYVYSSVEDAKNSENERVLYFSFPNDTTGIPQIVTINAGLAINLDDLIQMKNKYIGNTVKYVGFEQNDFPIQIDTCKYMKDPYPLTDLENNGHQIYIVIE